MSIKKNYSNIVGISILILGLLAGVLLVEQSQNYRNKAKETENILYTICHKTGDKNNPWEEIQVNENDLKKYIDQGDIVGECPPPEE